LWKELSRYEQLLRHAAALLLAAHGAVQQSGADERVRALLSVQLHTMVLMKAPLKLQRCNHKHGF
jgi:hypothetical protein